MVFGHSLGSACDSDNPDDCVFHPTGDNSQVHSSILSYGHLSNVNAPISMKRKQLKRYVTESLPHR